MAFIDGLAGARSFVDRQLVNNLGCEIRTFHAHLGLRAVLQNLDQRVYLCHSLRVSARPLSQPLPHGLGLQQRESGSALFSRQVPPHLRRPADQAGFVLTYSR
jgi:hypothetical protein